MNSTNGISPLRIAARNPTMFAVTVTEPTGAYYTHVFKTPEICIGRGPNNDLVLDDGNVSTSHARITMRDGKFIVVDTDSTNGVYVNGRIASKPVVIAGPNTIHIAIYELSVSAIRPS